MPIYILTVYVALGVFTILTGVSITFLSNMTQVAAIVNNVVIAWGVTKLPTLVPEAWAKSKFRISDGALKAVGVIGVAGALFNGYMNGSNLVGSLLFINLGILVVAFLFGTIRSKSIHMDISYETVD